MAKKVPVVAAPPSPAPSIKDPLKEKAKKVEKVANPQVANPQANQQTANK